MANKFVIEVRAKVFTNLEQQLKKADKATRGYEKSNQKLRGTTSGLRRQIRKSGHRSVIGRLSYEQ